MICQYTRGCIAFHNKSNEIASLWPVLSCICIDVYTRMCIHTYALFHRDETKPTHIIGISSFLFFMQLRYKHSSPNYQHMTSYCQLINKLLVFIDVCVCVSWNIFNRIHFFAVCDVKVFMQVARWKRDFICDVCRVDEAASTNSCFASHTICFTLLNNCITHSRTSRTIASSQYHPRETRSLLG